MIWINEQQLIKMQEQLVAESGGISGIRDRGMLQSAILSPLQSFGNVELFPGILQKAARLGYGLVANHSFIDGNKRIGAHAMLYVLAANGIKLAYTQQELTTLFLQIAAGELNYEDVFVWIVGHVIS